MSRRRDQFAFPCFDFLFFLFKTSLSLSGSRFVLTFELHDNSLKFFFTALSSLVLLLRSCRNGSSCMSRRRDQSAFPCLDFFFFLPLMSCTNFLAHRHSLLSLGPILLTPRTNLPLHNPSHLTTTPRTLDLVRVLQLPL